MEKLLHERLREYRKNSLNLNSVIKDEDEKTFFSMIEKWADEIERYYIPRPRFEGGEPVQFGEELENGKRVATMTYHIGGRCTINDTATWQGTCESDYELRNSETLKRPTPKVYDADGVEIKVGQNRFDIKSGIEITVSRFKKDDGGNTIVCANGDVCELEFDPSQLTNEKPVFDADNERICKGDTVYNKAGTRFTVTMVYPYGRVYCESEYEKDCEFKPTDLTHKEPDSQKRIDEDARKLVESISSRYGIDDTIWASDGVDGVGATTLLDEVAELLSRQRALIERGA